MTSPAVGSPASPRQAPACHVITHVHWDREWYRPFEAFRARLVELAEQVCAELDDGRLGAFHLDGQTVVLADIAAMRPDLAERLRAHASAGRLTAGPWHVLADNQLVSGENLIRNLLTARRWGQGATLAGVGYSPDAFGHPADLPRILTGFGMDTALVWRGAPPAHARFRWRSPDGSEVFAVNQGYHAAEVLWPSGTEHAPDDSGAAGDTQPDRRIADFLGGERERLPEGPWLLMNGGDHLAPTEAGARIAAAQTAAGTAGATLRESTLEEFFTDARTAAAGTAIPLVEGELRRPGDRLTFLLPGTLSARTPLKQANAAAQTLLERWAEPMLALHAPDDPTLLAELRHAWDLLISNSAHDSICGCSVDEVHRENAVRFGRVTQTGEHLLLRALAASGLDTRLYGERPSHEAHFAVLNPHGSPHTGSVEIELLTAPGRFPVQLLDESGESVPFETVALGDETAFEADLDLLPDSRPSLRHRLRLLAREIPALSRALFRVRLGDAPGEAAVPRSSDGAREFRTGDGTRVSAAADASLTLRLPDGAELSGFGRLVDGGDRGDTYNYDPPLTDRLVTPVLTASRRVTSPVRTTLELDATLTLPSGLTEDRDARTDDAVTLPLRVRVTAWHGEPSGVLHWDVEYDNTASDHRLRLHFPAIGTTGEWTGDGHYALVERPVAEDLGPLPEAPGHEAVCASAPVQSVAATGRDAHRVAVACPGLPEVRGIPDEAPGSEQLVVTLLRAVGWLSRFDLRSRTTGAGPMLATPEAQCLGRQTSTLTTAIGAVVADDLSLARFAAAHRAPLRGWQLRPHTGPDLPRPTPALRVDGSLLTSVKPAEDGAGVIVRLSNPTASPLPTTLHLPPGTTALACHLDETPAEEQLPPPSGGTDTGETTLTWTLAPYALTSLRLTGGPTPPPRP